MGYTPENNPYIPGDPYSYDLKWIVERLNQHKFAEQSAAEAKASALAAESYKDEAKSYADEINYKLKNIKYVSAYSGSDDTEVLQNAIDDALTMEECTLVIDKTLNIVRTINIIFTPAYVQSLTIQGMFTNVRSNGNVFHGDASPSLRNNMEGVIKCNVPGGTVFNVENRNDTPSLCVRDCIFFNSSEATAVDPNSWVWANDSMTLFYVIGNVCNFINNTAVGFEYFIYAPKEVPGTTPPQPNWTGDYSVIEKNTIYTCGKGVYLAYQDCADIYGNAFLAMYGATAYLTINVAHGISIRNNMFAPYRDVIPLSIYAGVTLRSCNAILYGNHGENSSATYVFWIADDGTATFIANQWTTTQSGNILACTGTAETYLIGNHFDTTPVASGSAKIIDVIDLPTMQDDITSLNTSLENLDGYTYVATAADWDEYVYTCNLVFNAQTTSIRAGYSSGFLETKFNSAGTLGTQTITWYDGKKSSRVKWYGTWGSWNLA